MNLTNINRKQSQKNPYNMTPYFVYGLNIFKMKKYIVQGYIYYGKP